jgi:hypothetical protein
LLNIRRFARDSIMTSSGVPNAAGPTGPMLFGGKSKLIAVIGDEVRGIFFLS